MFITRSNINTTSACASKFYLCQKVLEIYKICFIFQVLKQYHNPIRVQQKKMNLAAFGPSPCTSLLWEEMEPVGTSGTKESRDLPRPRDYNHRFPEFSPQTLLALPAFTFFPLKKIFFNLFFWLTPGLNVASKTFIFIAACKLLASVCTF